MKHPLQEMMDKRRQGIRCGIPSYCSANELVIEIALRRAKERNIPVLIEATANQVNQFGGYTGMKPADFYQMVLKMAKDIDLPENMMILAGDHLGPLTWQKLPEAEAMKNSVELVYQYARAGFTKIHLDTSMKVADDAPGLLKTEVIARRGAQLYKAAMKGYEELKAEKPDAMRPVFVIGSEVPIPGGATEAEDTLAVTSPDAFRDTVSTYQRVWTEEGVGDGMKDVIAVVVQPGVEFGDEQVFDYDPAAAVDLCAALKEFPDICFEGHSTDYQTATDLYNMVTDGIAILKVGPALTYGLREALFSLSMMEKELVPRGKARQLHRDAGRRHAGLPRKLGEALSRRREASGTVPQVQLLRPRPLLHRPARGGGRHEQAVRQSPRVPHPDEYAPPVYAHQLRKDPRGQAEARPARAGHGRHRAVHAGLRERCLIF